jgi:hypothetical protein
VLRSRSPDEQDILRSELKILPLKTGDVNLRALASGLHLQVARKVHGDSLCACVAAQSTCARVFMRPTCAHVLL